MVNSLIFIKILILVSKTTILVSKVVLGFLIMLEVETTSLMDEVTRTRTSLNANIVEGLVMLL